MNSYTLEQIDEGSAAVELSLYAVSPKTTLIGNAIVSLKFLMESVNKVHKIDFSTPKQDNVYVGSIGIKATLLGLPSAEEQQINNDTDITRSKDNPSTSSSTFDFDDPYVFAVHPVVEEYDATRSYNTHANQMQSEHQVSKHSLDSDDQQMFASSPISRHQGTTRGYNDFFSQKIIEPSSFDTMKETISVGSNDPYMFAAQSKSVEDNTFMYKSTIKKQSKDESSESNETDDFSSPESFHYM